MKIGMGYFIIGGLILIYSIFCFYVGIKKPADLFDVMKEKLGGGRDDGFTEKFCFSIAVITLIAGIAVLVFGYTRR